MCVCGTVAGRARGVCQHHACIITPAETGNIILKEELDQHASQTQENNKALPETLPVRPAPSQSPYISHTTRTNTGLKSTGTKA